MALFKIKKWEGLMVTLLQSIKSKLDKINYAVIEPMQDDVNIKKIKKDGWTHIVKFCVYPQSNNCGEMLKADLKKIFDNHTHECSEVAKSTTFLFKESIGGEKSLRQITIEVDDLPGIGNSKEIVIDEIKDLERVIVVQSFMSIEDFVEFYKL